MNVKLLKNLFVALVAAISISSCSSANDCAMASDEGVAKIKELIKAHVDINECKIYRIEWKEDWKERKLENVLSQISVDYIDKEDNDYNLTINYTDGEFVPEEPRKGKSVLNSYEYTTAIEIDGMNAEKIRHATGSLKTLSGSVEKITETQMNKDQITNPLEAIRGRVPGLTIQRGSNGAHAGRSGVPRCRSSSRLCSL